MPRVAAVVGATATGKTALALHLASQLQGEVVNADSRQVYRGMDIGTAKPTAAERQAVPHHLVDIRDPDDTLTLAAFLDLARAAIEEIAARRRLPIVVGGTGQYVWALLEGWRVPRVPPDARLRHELEHLARTAGTEALADVLRAEDPAAAATIDPRNVRRVIRAIEVTRATGRPFSLWQQKDGPRYDTTMVGLSLDRAELHRRIDARVEAMIAAGLVDEVRGLRAAGYPCSLPAMSSIGYRQICEMLDGDCTPDAAIRRMKTETHRLARLQKAWFKPGDPRINWLQADSPSLADDAIAVLSA